MSGPSTSNEKTSLLWKISSNDKNGDKYLTFSGNNSIQNQSNLTSSSSINNSYVHQRQELPPIRVYKVRWYILTVICLANIANAINWICYSSIADFTAEFYTIDYDQVNYLSLVYLVISIPTGFFSFILIDNFGLRSSINFGAWLNFIGAFLRVFSSINSASSKPLVDQDHKYLVLMIGQAFCASSQPFILFVSTKFANTWFADDQRALANTIALGSNTFGILIGSFVSPLIVDSSIEFISEISLLNIIYCVLSLVPALMATLITRSSPELPPSYSTIMMNREIDDLESSGLSKFSIFWLNFKSYLNECVKLLKSKDFLILFMSFGLSLGMFNSLTTLIEQILCTRGYSDNDAGIFGGSMIMSGIIGSIISGIILDKTKRFEELAKICFSMCALANIIFVLVQLYNNDSSLIYYSMLGSFILIGLFGLPLLPICMECCLECVYPIPEATSTGLLFLAGQVFGIAVIVGNPKIAKKIDSDSYIYNNVQTCTSTSWVPINSTTIRPPSNQLVVLDFNTPLFIQTIVFVFIAIFFTLFFKCSYLRLRSEREKQVEQILNSVSN
jgi:FLVCR family MFS transporter 7